MISVQQATEIPQTPPPLDPLEPVGALDPRYPLAVRPYKYGGWRVYDFRFNAWVGPGWRCPDCAQVFRDETVARMRGRRYAC